MCESIRTGRWPPKSKRKPERQLPVPREKLTPSSAARGQEPKFKKNKSPEPDMLGVERVENWPRPKRSRQSCPDKGELGKGRACRSHSRSMSQTASKRISTIRRHKGQDGMVARRAAVDETVGEDNCDTSSERLAEQLCRGSSGQSRTTLGGSDYEGLAHLCRVEMGPFGPSIGNGCGKTFLRCITKALLSRGTVMAKSKAAGEPR